MQGGSVTARQMRLGTFCSGIGAPECGGMGRPLWFCEIEPFPSAVLAHHFPAVPNFGDMTAPDLLERIAAVGLPDVVVAGIPCQPFSVAGLRKGLEDPRNLTSRFVELADAIDDLRCAAGLAPIWWCVENVPGLLSDTGNAFGAILGGLVGDDAAIDRPAGGWTNAGVVAGPRRVAAWRILDAQHFGVAQRRRRVFVLALGGAGAWACADALLPIAESLSGHPAPSREARQSVAGAPAGGARSGGGYIEDGIPHVAHCLNAKGGGGRIDGESETFIAHSLRADAGDMAPTLRAMGHSGSHANAGGQVAATTTAGVRRILPVEAEKLQGFPPGWTAILYRGKPAADGPRYKALGNSMAVPCMAYIGQRIRSAAALIRTLTASEAA